MHYHIAIRGVQSGPHTEEVVRQKLSSGELSPTDLCWREGWPDWQPVAVAFPALRPPASPAFPETAPPPFGSPPAAARPETSGLAIASLVLGLASFFGSIFTAVPAVICGHLARSRIKHSGGAVAGGGLALAGLITGYLAIAFFTVIIAAIVVPTVGKVRETARRSVDSSNLRQIAMSSLIYASDHGDKLPVATDTRAYAVELAREAGLTDATVWVAGSDAAAAPALSTVLQADRSGIHPDFGAARLSFVVTLGGVSTGMPSTVPIAWTRGLEADGTWSEDNPYGGEGGHIAFLGGNVVFYRSLAGAPLQRFDGGGTTTDIREALPPGMRTSSP